MVRGFFIILPLVVLVLLAGPAAAETAPAEADTTAEDIPTPLPVELDEEFFDRLDEQTCTDLNAFAYREIPRFVLGDRPDLLYEFLLYWESRCLTTEPVFRLLLLGSIWDGNFDEGIYGEEVIDHLIDRYDPPVESKFPDLRKNFDDFSQNFADQLLPHAPHHSPQEFFCLFYAGKTAEAWALLESEDLEDTWLFYYYDQEMIELTWKNEVNVYEVTGGIWWPRGNVEFVGEMPVIGAAMGIRYTHWMWRMLIDMRLGRTDQPYWVDEEGVNGRSNRFNAVYWGAEFGRILAQKGPHNLDLFVGFGIEFIKPFKDEDFAIMGLNGNLGLGYRVFVGRNRTWLLGADVRREWVENINQDLGFMSGGAWSLRFSVGYAPNNGKFRRLEGLGQ